MFKLFSNILNKIKCAHNSSKDSFPQNKYSQALLVGPNIKIDAKQDDKKLLYSKAEHYSQIIPSLNKIKDAKPKKVVVIIHSGDRAGYIGSIYNPLEIIVRFFRGVRNLVNYTPLELLKASGAKYGSFYSCYVGAISSQLKKSSDSDKEGNSESIVQKISLSWLEDYKSLENGTYIKLNAGRIPLLLSSAQYSIRKELEKDNGKINPVEDFIEAAINSATTKKLIFKVDNKLHSLKISAPKFSEKEAQNMTPKKLKKKIRCHLTDKILQFINYMEESGAVGELGISKEKLLEKYFTKENSGLYKLKLTDEQINFYAEHALLVELDKCQYKNYSTSKQAGYIQSYLRGGVDINTPRLIAAGLNTPLTLACCSGNKQMVEFLLRQEKININLSDNLVGSPITYATEYRRPRRVINILLKDPHLELSKSAHDKLLKEREGGLIYSLLNIFNNNKKNTEEEIKLIKEAYQRNLDRNKNKKHNKDNLQHISLPHESLSVDTSISCKDTPLHTEKPHNMHTSTGRDLSQRKEVSFTSNFKKLPKTQPVTIAQWEKLHLSNFYAAKLYSANNLSPVVKQL